MNIKQFRWINGTLISAALIGLLSACSDDHFEVNPEVLGRTTLWENIENNDELTEFADILRRVKYSKSEGSTTSETYESLLKTNQTFTIWAPTNGSFDYAYYDNLLKTGNPTDAYKVEKELIRNSMTRFSHVLTGSDSMDLKLFNNKKAVFNCAKGTMKGQSIIKPNISANNGVLHIINGAVAYQPNLYEFLAEHEELDSLNKFIKSYETIEFNENASTQGPTIDGQISWVDSVTYVNNDYFYIMRAYLNREDSSYAMIMPTNKAWRETLEKTQKYYVYNDSYEMLDPSSTTARPVYNTYSFSKAEIDSIRSLYSKDAIVGNLAFNAKYQYGKKYTDFAIEGACDSLTSTREETYYDPDCAKLFDGAEPQELSNGYAYIVDNFNYKPEQAWAFERVYEAEYTNYLEKETRCTLTPTRIYIDNVNGEPLDTAIQITVAKTKTTSSVNPEVTFKIPRTLSCKYDIYVLMAYNVEANKPTVFRASIGYHELGKSKYTTTNLYVPEGVHGEGRNFENRVPHLDENGKFQYVDSVLVARDFEFPVAYIGVDDNVYATLTLTAYVTNTRLYTREMWIDKIILKAKEE